MQCLAWDHFWTVWFQAGRDGHRNGFSFTRTTCLVLSAFSRLVDSVKSLVLVKLTVSTQPPTQRWCAKLEAQLECTLQTHFCTFGVDFYDRSVLINKISASEPSWKFIKSALLVGHWYRAEEKKSSPLSPPPSSKRTRNDNNLCSSLLRRFSCWEPFSGYFLFPPPSEALFFSRRSLSWEQKKEKKRNTV